jgi:hypothetical protein
MMNNKGQMGLAGGLIMVAITIIVGIILLTASAQNIGDVVNTNNLVNQSLGAAAVQHTTQYIANCRALSSVVVFNATGDAEVPATNFTITNNALDASGNLAVNITPKVMDAKVLANNRGLWQVSGVCQPTTYDNSSGGRAIAGIIIIMFAVALAVVSLTPSLRSDILGALGK